MEKITHSVKFFNFLAVMLITASIGGCQPKDRSATEENVKSSESETAEVQITDYFPVETGNTWTYTNGTGKLNETIFVQNSTERDIPLYLFVDQILGMGQTSTMHGVEDNKIVIVVTKNILGQYKENQRPFPVQLAPANQSWRQDEGNEEYYLFKTAKSSIKYDDKSFNDCILVERQVYTNNSLFTTKRSYFAKNVGLVYVSLQEDGKEETCYQKLIDCSFVDLTDYKSSLTSSPDYELFWGCLVNDSVLVQNAIKRNANVNNPKLADGMESMNCFFKKELFLIDKGLGSYSVFKDRTNLDKFLEIIVADGSFRTFSWGDDELTPLAIAVLYMNTEIVRMLVNEGAYVNPGFLEDDFMVDLTNDMKNLLLSALAKQTN